MTTQAKSRFFKKRKVRSYETERVEGEPDINRDSNCPKTDLTELTDEYGSTTGIMDVLRDPADESAKRDEDMPEQ